MKKYAMSWRTLIVLTTAVLFISCKTVAILPTKTPVKKVDVNALASKVKSNYPKANKLRARIRAIYDDGKRKQQVIIQMRMEREETVWLSASMVIPIAKLLVTKEGVSFYEKFQKNYFKGDFELINAPFNTSFSYDDIENLLLGKPFVDPSEGRWKQIANPQYYILIPQGKKGGLQPTLFFDPVTFLLKEQRILVPGSLQNITVRYTNHQRIQGDYFPQQIEVIIVDGAQRYQLDLEYTRTDLPSALSFPFEIPEGYKPISF
jgi:hypothetical protein